jgi:hypothetical protein
MAMVMHESNGRSRIMSCARRQRTHAYARLMWEYYSCALLASTSKQHAVERERLPSPEQHPREGFHTSLGQSSSLSPPSVL